MTNDANPTAKIVQALKAADAYLRDSLTLCQDKATKRLLAQVTEALAEAVKLDRAARSAP